MIEIWYNGYDTDMAASTFQCTSKCERTINNLDIPGCNVNYCSKSPFKYS